MLVLDKAHIEKICQQLNYKILSLELTGQK